MLLNQNLIVTLPHTCTLPVPASYSVHGSSLSSELAQPKRPPACPAGYALVSARLFTVGATRPTLTLTSASASGRGASFAFKAAALSPVAFQCTLDRTASSAATAGVRPVPGSALLPAWGTPVPCASPAARPFSCTPMAKSCSCGDRRHAAHQTG